MPDGQYTSAVYTAIKDARYPEAIRVLTSELGVGGDCSSQSSENTKIHTPPSYLVAHGYLLRLSTESDLPFLLEKRPDLKEHGYGLNAVHNIQ